MITTIKISDVLHALANGQTWNKKDDIGFGNLEKDYKLTPKDIAQLKAHPKLQGVETKIPSLLIIDDTEDIGVKPQPITPSTEIHGELQEEVRESKIEVAKEIVYKKPEEPVIYEAFI